QRRHSWAEKGAVFSVMVQTCARAQRQPARNLDIVLNEDAGNGEPIRELWKIHGTEHVVFHSGTCHPRVTAGRTANGDFSKAELVTVPLADVAKDVRVPLPGKCRASSDEKPLPNRHL